MNKTSVEHINKTYTFPLPGSKARISVKYTRPQTHEGSISVVVSGWITDENKNQFPFTGSLVKSFGTNFKDMGKDLTESLEIANEKSGNPIQNAYDFVNSKIIPSVPYDAMDDFFKGIKNRKKKKVEKVVPKLHEKGVPKEKIEITPEQRKENTYNSALEFYEKNKFNNNMNIDVAESMLEYKISKGLPIDERDKYWETRIQENTKRLEEENKGVETVPNKNWIKKLFNRGGN